MTGRHNKSEEREKNERQNPSKCFKEFSFQNFPSFFETSGRRSVKSKQYVQSKRFRIKHGDLMCRSRSINILPPCLLLSQMFCKTSYWNIIWMSHIATQPRDSSSLCSQSPVLCSGMLHTLTYNLQNKGWRKKKTHFDQVLAMFIFLTHQFSYFLTAWKHLSQTARKLLDFGLDRYF